MILPEWFEAHGDCLNDARCQVGGLNRGQFERNLWQPIKQVAVHY